MLLVEKSWLTGTWCIAGRLEFKNEDDMDFAYAKEQAVAIILGFADPVEL